jgi:hypothetical protein
MDRSQLTAASLAVLLIGVLQLPTGAAAKSPNTPVRPVGPPSRARALNASPAGALGPILTVPGQGGTIFGFDLDQHGTDGLLAFGRTINDGNDDAVVDEFDQTTAKITKVVASLKNSQNDYVVDGIFAGDVALVDNEIAGINGIVPTYLVMNPLTGGLFTGTWTPPVARERVLGYAENQTTSTSILFAINLNNGDAPDLLVSNIAAGTFVPVIALNPNAFALGAQPQLAQDTVLNDAVLATSPDFGKVGVGTTPPLIEMINVSTGKTTHFNGFNNGPVGAGFVNGLAVDSNTHIACTTTELNASVEFYDLRTRTGITVSLPDTTLNDQIAAGWGIAVDQVNKLFLVTQPYDSVTGTGSAIYAYDEKGQLVEAIHGFSFSFPGIALNPSARIGYVTGPALNQLRQFTY